MPGYRPHTPSEGDQSDRLDAFVRYHAMPHTPEREAVRGGVESAVISAVWTLRRLPDRDRAFLFARQVMWPEMAEGDDYSPGGGVDDQRASPAYGRQSRPSPRQIDAMQPALDLLALLPDQGDRQILFWGAWHQHGAPQSRIPWTRVARTVALDLSRWSYKRRYGQALDWLSSLVCRHLSKKIRNSEKNACTLSPFHAP